MNCNQLPKLTAVSLSLVYFFTQSLWANAPETSLWEQRRQHLQGNAQARLPQPTLALPDLPTPQAMSLVTKSFESIPGFSTRQAPASLLSILKALPHQNGNVRQVSLPATGANGKTLLHIQDIHLNHEAQVNIVNTLEQLFSLNQVDVVALEGVFSSVDLGPYQRFPNRDSMKRIADYLLRTGKISGAVYTYLTHTPGTPPLTGVDDYQHYFANVEAYKSSVEQTAFLKEKLAKQKADFDKQKAAILNPTLLALQSKVESYRQGQLPLGDYLNALASSQPRSLSSSIDTFLQALKLEKALNFPLVERERRRLLEQVSDKLSKEESASLVDHAAAYRAGQLGHGDFYRHLETLCQKKGLPLTQFPALKGYITYILLSDRINANQLFDDIHELESDSLAAHAKTPQDQEVLAQAKQLYLTQKLVDFSLTPDEWADYKSQGTAELAAFESFYQEAMARDALMAQNTLKALETSKAQVAVLVTGGFHSRGMEDHFKKAGVTVVSYTPKVTKIDTAEGSSYLTAFTQEKTPLEKLFEGEKLFITPDQTQLGLTRPLAAADAKRSGTSAQQAFDALPGDPAKVQVEVLPADDVIVTVEKPNHPTQRIVVNFEGEGIGGVSSLVPGGSSIIRRTFDGLAALRRWVTDLSRPSGRALVYTGTAVTLLAVTSAVIFYTGLQGTPELVSSLVDHSRSFMDVATWPVAPLLPLGLVGHARSLLDIATLPLGGDFLGGNSAGALSAAIPFLGSTKGLFPSSHKPSVLTRVPLRERRGFMKGIVSGTVMAVGVGLPHLALAAPTEQTIPLPLDPSYWRMTNGQTLQPAPGGGLVLPVEITPNSPNDPEVFANLPETHRDLAGYALHATVDLPESLLSANSNQPVRVVAVIKTGAGFREVNVSFNVSRRGGRFHVVLPLDQTTVQEAGIGRSDRNVYMDRDAQMTEVRTVGLRIGRGDLSNYSGQVLLRDVRLERIQPAAAVSREVFRNNNSGINLIDEMFGYRFGNMGAPSAGYSEPGNARELDALFQRYALDGFKVVRVPLFADFRGDVVRRDAQNLITGFSNRDRVMADLRTLFDTAERHGLQVVPIFISYQLGDGVTVQNFSTARGGVSSSRGFYPVSRPQAANAVGEFPNDINNPLGRQRLLEHVIGPIVDTFAAHPAVRAWDLLNEPDLELATSLNIADVQAYCREASERIHLVPGAQVTLGAKTLTTLMKYWTSVGLDLLQVHFYSDTGDELVNPLTVNTGRYGFAQPVWMGEMGPVNIPGETARTIQALHKSGVTGVAYWHDAPLGGRYNYSAADRQEARTAINELSDFPSALVARGPVPRRGFLRAVTFTPSVNTLGRQGSQRQLFTALTTATVAAIFVVAFGDIFPLHALELTAEVGNWRDLLTTFSIRFFLLLGVHRQMIRIAEKRGLLLPGAVSLYRMVVTAQVAAFISIPFSNPLAESVLAALYFVLVFVSFTTPSIKTSSRRRVKRPPISRSMWAIALLASGAALFYMGLQDTPALAQGLVEHCRSLMDAASLLVAPLLPPGVKATSVVIAAATVRFVPAFIGQEAAVTEENTDPIQVEVREVQGVANASSRVLAIAVWREGLPREYSYNVLPARYTPQELEERLKVIVTRIAQKSPTPDTIDLDEVINNALTELFGELSQESQAQKAASSPAGSPAHSVAAKALKGTLVVALLIAGAWLLYAGLQDTPTLAAGLVDQSNALAQVSLNAAAPVPWDSLGVNAPAALNGGDGVFAAAVPILGSLKRRATKGLMPTDWKHLRFPDRGVRLFIVSYLNALRALETDDHARASQELEPMREAWRGLNLSDQSLMASLIGEVETAISHAQSGGYLTAVGALLSEVDNISTPEQLRDVFKRIGELDNEHGNDIVFKFLKAKVAVLTLMVDDQWEAAWKAFDRLAEDLKGQGPLQPVTDDFVQMEVLRLRTKLLMQFLRFYGKASAPAFTQNDLRSFAGQYMTEDMLADSDGVNFYPMPVIFQILRHHPALNVTRADIERVREGFLSGRLTDEATASELGDLGIELAVAQSVVFEWRRLYPGPVSPAGVGMHRVGLNDDAPGTAKVQALVKKGNRKTGVAHLRQGDLNGVADDLHQALHPTRYSYAHGPLDQLQRLGLIPYISQLGQILRDGQVKIDGRMVKVVIHQIRQSVEKLKTGELPAVGVRDGDTVTLIVHQDSKNAIDLASVIHEGLQHLVFPAANDIPPQQWHSLAYAAEILANNSENRARKEWADAPVPIPDRTYREIQGMTLEELDVFIEQSIFDTTSKLDAFRGDDSWGRKAYFILVSGFLTRRAEERRDKLRAQRPPPGGSGGGGMGRRLAMIVVTVLLSMKALMAAEGSLPITQATQRDPLKLPPAVSLQIESVDFRLGLVNMAAGEVDGAAQLANLEAALGTTLDRAALKDENYVAGLLHQFLIVGDALNLNAPSAKQDLSSPVVLAVIPQGMEGALEEEVQNVAQLHHSFTGERKQTLLVVESEDLRAQAEGYLPAGSTIRVVAAPAAFATDVSGARLVSGQALGEIGVVHDLQNTHAGSVWRLLTPEGLAVDRTGLPQGSPLAGVLILPILFGALSKFLKNAQDVARAIATAA